MLWLAVCLFPAVFCFWQASAPAPAHPTRPATAAPPRYISKSIEDIREGDWVLARDEFGRQVGMKRVVETYRSISDHLRILTFRAPEGTEQTLETTNTHPFWSQSDSTWKSAATLEVGDTVTGPRGEPQLLVESRYELHPQGVAVYNFHVDDYHTYFVQADHTSAPPLLVHNTSPGSQLGYSMKEVRHRWWNGSTPVRPNSAMPRGREYKELSHTYISNNGAVGRYLPARIKNGRWNLKPMWGSEHALVDPSRYRFMNSNWKQANPLPAAPIRLWGRMPGSHRVAGGIAVIGGAGYVIYEALDE